MATDSNKRNRGQNYPKIFSDALRTINTELCKQIKDGRRKYFHKKDLEYAYDSHKGYCAFCAKSLRTRGRGPGGVSFMLRVPLKAGGKVDKDNLLPVCTRCKEDQTPKKMPGMRVSDYNTIPDLIVHLFKAVDENDATKITYFKRAINGALTELAQTLHYTPLGGAPEAVERVEGVNSASDLIAELAKVFQEIRETKQYKPTKER